MKVVIISQARMTSTRLPGKVLKPVLGKPLLAYQIERLRRVKGAAEVVIATTTNAADDAIVALCEELSCAFYRGSENDVLSRYYEAAAAFEADAVVRVTSDCPVIDPAVIDDVIDLFRLADRKRYDYVSNTLTRSFPRGMDAEIFSFPALVEAHAKAILPYEREHVTPFFYQHPEKFALGNVAHRQDESRHRWTVDTIEDFELLERIITALYPSHPAFTLGDMLQLLEGNPSWALLNAHVEQKKLRE